MKKIIINSGSSSIKMSVFHGDEEIASLSVDRIGEGGSRIKCEFEGREYCETSDIENHETAMQMLSEILISEGIVSSLSEIEAMAHRVVHGGEYFSQTVLIDDEVLEKIEDCIECAPLHNPINLTCIQVAMKLFIDIPHIAVFDTAFHQTIPKENYLYAIPRRFYEKYKIRKYGFHGISHQYISERVLKISDRAPKKIISCHIGNGASITAILDGKSVNNSMGYTPVDGLVMGTRAGDIDPGVVLFLQEKENLSAKETSDLINKHSGMLGLTGKVGDLKDIEDGIVQKLPDFQLALDIYVSRIVRFIGAYIADIGGVDAIVFTAGVLENSRNIRKLIAERLTFCGMDFDPSLNDFRGEERKISTESSQTELFVIPTNEELMMNKEIDRLLV